jgi:hypothetical protein
MGGQNAVNINVIRSLTMKMTLLRSRKFRFAMLAVALIALAGLAALTFVDFGLVRLPGASYPIYLGGWADMHFDKNLWLDAETNWPLQWGGGAARDNRRSRMLNDLLRHRLRKGMTKVQVEHILGPPPMGGDGYELYDLLKFPSIDQKIVAWLRWRSSRPVLELTYRGETGKEKLRGAKVLCSRGWRDD